jgi:hypothetical protein
LGGGKIAHFVPTAAFYGLGSFQFKVTDASGFSFTNNVGVHVGALPQSQLGFSLSNGAPQLTFTGEAGFEFLIQSSPDLKNWTTWTNATGTASPVVLTPPNFANSQARYYRALSVQ